MLCLLLPVAAVAEVVVPVLAMLVELVVQRVVKTAILLMTGKLLMAVEGVANRQLGLMLAAIRPMLLVDKEYYKAVGQE